MWKHMMEKIKSRFSDWKWSLLTLEGRFTLLKSVICSLSIFWLSFNKVSVNIWRDIEKVQKKICMGRQGGFVGFIGIKCVNQTVYEALW